MNDEALKIRRQKLLIQYQQHRACADNIASGNTENTRATLPAVTGQIAGRSVSQIIVHEDSNTSRQQQSYRNSPKADQSLPNYVNTVKKTEILIQQSKQT